MDFNQRTTEIFEAPISPLNWNSLLRECEAIEKDNAYFPTGFLWVLEYKRYQIEVARNNLGRAKRHLKAAIGLVPYTINLVQEYKALHIRDAAFKYIALIITCKKYEDKALGLAKQFDACNMEYALVTGSDTDPIDHPRAIQVDAPDNYESLPSKVFAACTWVYENIGSNVGVLKIDDDMSIESPAKLQGLLDQFLAKEIEYAGRPIAVGAEHDRCWHWHKCQDPALNTRVYGRPFYRPWAGGSAYFIGPKALEKLIISMIRFPAQVDGEYYEDKLVGDLLMFEGIPLHPIEDFEEMGLSSTIEREDRHAL